MDRVVDSDNKFFSTLFFPAFTSPQREYNPIPKKLWTKLNDNVPLVGILLKVLLVYWLYRVVKRVALCMAPGLFHGTCWLDTIRNVFRCKDRGNCPQTRCPMRECPF